MKRGIEWAAGLFEGEGCVSIGRRPSDRFKSEVGRATLVVSLKSTDEDVVREFARIVGCGTVNPNRWYEQNGYKPQWSWRTPTLAEAGQVIELLLPFMCGRRREKMEEALRLLEAKRERRSVAYRENGGKRLAKV